MQLTCAWNRDTVRRGSGSDSRAPVLPVYRIMTYNVENYLLAPAGTRPPKNGISARLSVCVRLEVKIISAPA